MDRFLSVVIVVAEFKFVEYEANTNSLVCLPTGPGGEEYLTKYILGLELALWN